MITEKVGLLSRLFRRSTRRKGGSPLMGTFSAQYPPTEWFNPRVVHLHSVATQTRAASPSVSVYYKPMMYCINCTHTPKLYTKLFMLPFLYSPYILSLSSYKLKRNNERINNFATRKEKYEKKACPYIYLFQTAKTCIYKLV